MPPQTPCACCNHLCKCLVTTLTVAASDAAVIQGCCCCWLRVMESTSRTRRSSNFMIPLQPDWVSLARATVGNMRPLFTAVAGLRNIEQDVDKDVWLAKSAQGDADAEDEEIARLLEQLEGLDESMVRADPPAVAFTCIHTFISGLSLHVHSPSRRRSKWPRRPRSKSWKRRQPS